MSGIVSFKVGTTWNVPIAYTPVEGLAPANLANTTISSQLRKQQDGGVICTFVTTKDGDNLGFTLTANGGTAAWPVGIVAVWDIKLVDTVFGTFFSDTTQVRLEQPVTR